MRKFTPVYGEVVVAALLINFFTIGTSLFSMQVYDRVVPNKAEETLLMLATGVITDLRLRFHSAHLARLFPRHGRQVARPQGFVGAVPACAVDPHGRRPAIGRRLCQQHPVL